MPAPKTGGAGWPALLLIAAGVVLYAASLDAPFLPDDQRSIVANRQIQSLSTALSPPRDTPVAGRPLVNLTFALNYAADGLDVDGYRGINVALHIGAALLLFGLVRRTILLWREREPGSDLPATAIGWLCAMVWLVHPLQTEAVIYLSQRTELMMGLFYLATLYCTARGWTPAAVLACALGMLCKESMVTAPVVVVLYERIFRFQSFRDALRAHGIFYGSLAATWLILGLLLWLQPRTSVGFETGVAPWTYLLNQCEIVLHYLTLAVWPAALVWDYGLPRALTLADAWPQAVVLTLLFVAAIVLLFRKPVMGFLLLWVFVTLAPTSSFVPIATEVGAERRMYLPLAGLAVLAVLGAHQLLKGFGARVTYAVVLLACIVLGGVAYTRAQDYQSLRQLAQTTVDRWPNGRGRYHLAVELLDAGSTVEGMRQLELAAPEFPGARYALAIQHLSENRLNEAVTEMDAFVRALPDHPNAVAGRDLLGRIYLSQGRIAESIQQFDIVLQFSGYPKRAEVVQLRQQAESLRGRS